MYYHYYYYYYYYYHYYTYTVLVYFTYIIIDFCHKSKAQRLKITKNSYNVAKILTNLVRLQNLFSKIIFS